VNEDRDRNSAQARDGESGGNEGHGVQPPPFNLRFTICDLRFAST
jgi:hypothetical protein